MHGDSRLDNVLVDERDHPPQALTRHTPVRRCRSASTQALIRAGKLDETEVHVAPGLLGVERRFAATFGWYESVALEEQGRPVRWLLEVDEMVNANNSSKVDTVGAMSGVRLGSKRPPNP